MKRFKKTVQCSNSITESSRQSSVQFRLWTVGLGEVSVRGSVSLMEGRTYGTCSFAYGNGWTMVVGLGVVLGLLGLGTGWVGLFLTEVEAASTDDDCDGV